MKNIRTIIGLLVVGAVAVWYFFFKRKTIYMYDAQYPADSSLPLSRAKALADVMFIAMEIPGTDEDTIDSVYNEIVQYRNGFSMLSYAFGKRKYLIAGSSGENVILDFLADDLNLIGWLEKELSISEIKKWRELY